MLLIVTCLAAALSLMGVLLVGGQTARTVSQMAPVRAAAAELTAFPGDVEQQIATQQQSPSIAMARTRDDQRLRNRIRQRAAGLRDSLDAAKLQVGSEQPELGKLYADLESLLVQDPAELDSGVLEQLREQALRQLTAQDGTVVLPRFDLNELSADPRVATLAEQVARLQAGMNGQLSELGVLEGLDIAFDSIPLSGDLGQLESAIRALGLQQRLLGIDAGSSAEYTALRELGETLLSRSATSLDGLDADQLRTITADLLEQLGAQYGESLGDTLSQFDAELLDEQLPASSSE